ncbi:hypothetical protein [Amycolatopsis keratiniphila]|uniref:Uncharacterized protein n=1 Tax=Amycolatopsis keratiniphila subsp. keratiniphila TaxID=227715 RepID=A0A1W2LP89_9PSEU|nr:hypothetical protein [Amycolatopsis keratiniphila]ONF65169.1 hypothetical protein AVR91_0227405 [Amycolatopsis keratiniphila subsp. keratiniphila]
MEDHRIRVLEPPEGIPAKNMPVLTALLDRSTLTAGTITVATGLLVVLGAVLAVSGGYGIAVPSALLVLMTPSALYFGYSALAGSSSMRKLTGKPFRLVSGLDGALVAGSRVSVPLDGRWLVMRLPVPLLAQLAARRRLWVLGRFFVLPGVVVPRRGAVRDKPVKGSVPFAFEPVSPGRMLATQRRLLSAYYFIGVVMLLVASAFGFWTSADYPRRDSVVVRSASVFGYGCAVGAVGLAIVAVVLLRKLPEPRWTELAVVSGPASVNLFGMVTCKGRTVLPGGREVTVTAGGSDPSLAANIAATGRLWVLGEPAAGKTAQAGVPGYAVFGPVRFGR